MGQTESIHIILATAIACAGAVDILKSRLSKNQIIIALYAVIILLMVTILFTETPLSSLINKDQKSTAEYTKVDDIEKDKNFDLYFYNSPHFTVECLYRYKNPESVGPTHP